MLPHKSENSVENWYKQELEDIAYTNWPQLFDDSKIIGIAPDVPFKDEKIKAMRQINVSYMRTMPDGSVTMALGMGSNSSGIS